MKPIVVPQFDVDHQTLQAGLHLREVKWINLFTKVNIWDLRFVAPSSHTPLSAATMHTIEHLMVHHLRAVDVLGKKYVGFFPNGSKTGFSLVAKSSLSKEKIVSAVVEVIENSVPLFSMKEIPGLNPAECGNPGLFNLKETSTALVAYKSVLLSQ